MTVSHPRPILSAVLVCPLVAACSPAPASQAPTPQGIAINDPFEARNRRVHAFKKGLDARVITPVANRPRGSGERAPRDPDAPIGPLQMVINAGRNLSLPVKSANGLLQGRPRDAGANLTRFAVNTIE